ncbi:MAG: sulfotransferase [Deltaproteobacteria bacterium]|nr:MAG: sulfotransferase [Deltaproteobacteria bacterium]
MSRPIAFVLGTPRSGTTLLRVMLEGHPGLFVPPEMVLGPYETMAEREEGLSRRFWEKGGLRRALMELRGISVQAAREAVHTLREQTVREVYEQLQNEIGERMLVDKCPHLGMPDGSLERLIGWFPHARFVWIVRNPASVIRSLQNMPMAEVMLQGYPGGPTQVWEVSNTRIEAFLRDHVPEDRWARVRYEDLVTDPEPELRRAASALGIEYHPAMATPYEGERMRTGPKGARAIGDPNLAGRGKLDPSLATKWLDGFDHRTVSEGTKALASRYGYDLESLPLPGVTAIDAQLQQLFATATGLLREMDLPQDIDALEGRRFLVRMVSASLDTFTEHADPDHPVFHHGEGPTRKMFADNPDTDYHRATIRTAEGQLYKVSGTLPADATYVGVLLYGRGGRIGNRLVDDQLRPAADGSFTLYIATQDPSLDDGVWLRADGDETAIFVRQYFTDRDAQTPITLSIERIGAPPAGPLTIEGYQKGIERADRMLKAVFARTAQALQMATGMALNRFIQIPGEALFPTPDNTYQVCWYRFGRDQIMLVRSTLPESRYFSLALYNAWMESLDYLNHRVSLNHRQIQCDPDGSFEICLAHRDPGHPNWLDTTGHHAGYLLARNLLLEGEAPTFEIQVMYEHEWAEARPR